MALNEYYYFLDTRDGNLISSRLVIKSVDNHINQGVFYCNMFTVLNWCPISLLVRETSPIPIWIFLCIMGNSRKFNLLNPITTVLFYYFIWPFFFSFFSLLCHFCVN